MVEEVGGGVANYMQAVVAPKVQAKPNVELARPEVAETKTEERGDTPPSKKAVEVQISAEAKQMAEDTSALVPNLVVTSAVLVDVA